MTVIEHAVSDKVLPAVPRHSFSGRQYKVIIISFIAHTIILFLLCWAPLNTVSPQAQIIRVNLETEETSGENPKRETRKAVFGNKRMPVVKKTEVISAEKRSVQDYMVREMAAVEKTVEAKENLCGDRPAISSEQNLEKGAETGTLQRNGNESEKVGATGIQRGSIAETEFGKMDAPRFVYREMPVYPLAARRLGKEGNVHLKLLIDGNGRLQEVEVVKGDGFGFTEAAVMAVKNSTFLPASLNGEKITSRALLTVRFCLQ